MPGDAHYSTVVLRLPLDGSNGATTTVDKSQPSPATITFGGGAQLSTAYGAYGSASSLLLTGSSGGNVTTNRSCGIGSGDFWISAKIRPTAAQQGRVVSNQNSSSVNALVVLRLEANGSISGLLRDSTGAGLLNLTSSAGLVATDGSADVEVAMGRSGTTVNLFVGGTIVATGTSSTSPNGSGVGYNIGSQYNAAEFFKGYVDDVVINEGYCYYTANYTPSGPWPTSPLYQGSGFLPTLFGTATVVSDVTVTATGWLATVFGSATVVQRVQATGFNPTVFGTAQNIPNAVGFFATRFGNIQVNRKQTASGFAPMVFGSARQVFIRQATGFGPTSRFGLAWTPTYRVQPASGWSAIVFGRAHAIATNPPNPDRLLYESGIKPTTFGRASVHASVTGSATGWNPSSFGTASASVRPICQATGFASGVAFGTAKAIARQRATGFATAAFGQAKVIAGCQATSMGQRTRMGTCTYVRGNAYFARGWFGWRYGHATALRRFNYPATSIAPATTFGTATAIPKQRAVSIPPDTHFGIAQAVRNPKC